MAKQLKVVIAHLGDREVWITSSVPLDDHKEMFEKADQKLQELVSQNVFWACVREGDKTLVVTLTGEWANVEDQFLQAFLPGLCGVSADFAIHDRGANEPRRRFTLRINDKLETPERVLQEDILINM